MSANTKKKQPCARRLFQKMGYRNYFFVCFEYEPQGASFANETIL